MSSLLSIQLLGDFHLVHEGRAVTTTTSDRLLSLLVYLLLHREAPQPRHLVAFRLWPDSTEAQARSNLRNLIYHLRRALPDSDQFLIAETSTIQWNGEAPFTLDVAEFQRAVEEAKQAEKHGNAEQVRASLERAVGLYAGDLLPGVYDEWIDPLREELRQLFQKALEELVQLLEAAGEYRNGIRYAQRLIQLDPLHETSYVQLMRLYALSGDRAGVRRAYESCASVLKTELDVEPSTSTREAYEQLLRMQPSPPPAPVVPIRAPVAEPEPVAPPERTWTLPPQPTPFLGREEELEELRYLLADAECRLLTLIGPGGIGKSRLALRAAEEYVEATGEPAAFVSLAPVSSADLLVPAIADALGFSFYGADSPREQLLGFLREKQMLLVLDNLEHLLEGVGLISDILQSAPGVRILATSRERLNLREEWVFGLEGLTVPADLQGAQMEENSAVALFLQSARRAYRGFVLPQEEQGAVARICRMVVGMPLGIELAAAWARVLSPTEIATEIERSLDFLVGSQRNAPERHRSLRAVFEHSWFLLSPQEQAVLRRLSILRGSFTREAAEQVARATLPLLASLTDKSLLRRDASGRYSLHEMVRQYAMSYLAADPAEESATRDRHAEYFAGWLERAEAPLKSARQRETTAEISSRIDDIRAAWQWAIERRQLGLLGRMIPSLHWFYEVRGNFREGARLFEQAVETLRGASATLTPAELNVFGFLLNECGWFTFRLGQNEQALAFLQESLTVLAPLGDPQALYYLHVNWAYFSVTREDWPEVERFTRATIDYARALGSWHLAVGLSIFGTLFMARGDADGAYRQLHESLELWRTVGDPRGLSFTLNFLSSAAQAVGKPDEAVAVLRESIALAVETGDPWAEATALNLLGRILSQQGDEVEALALFQQCVALYREIGDRLGMMVALANVGYTHKRLGNEDEATRACAEALELAVEARNLPAQADALFALAQVQPDANGEAALAWVVAVLQHPGTSDETRALAEQLRAQLEAQLTPQQAEVARARAQGKTLQEVAAQAVETVGINNSAQQSNV